MNSSHGPQWLQEASETPVMPERGGAPALAGSSICRLSNAVGNISPAAPRLYLFQSTSICVFPTCYNCEMYR